VTTSHVQLITRAARHRERVFAEHVDVLVDAARTVAPEPFVKVARTWRHLADDVVAGGASGDGDRWWLDTSVTFEGAVRVDGLLDPEGGATFMRALAALVPPPVAGDPRPAAARRADALVALAAGTRPRVSLDVHVDVDTLAGRMPADLLGARCEVDGVGPAPPSVVRRLACDARVALVATDGEHPHDVGRVRLVPLALRRALERRDGGCVFPGCDRPPKWCDAHHVIPWVEGGPTTLDNLALLCRSHHTRCHRDGWQLTRGPDGWTATPPERMRC
jgi:Domain of unknown function (DUF222)/HNH endonuclease